MLTVPSCLTPPLRPRAAPRSSHQLCPGVPWPQTPPEMERCGPRPHWPSSCPAPRPKHPQQTPISPALTGHPRSARFFSQPSCSSKQCQETRASCQLVPLSPLSPPSSSLQIAYQRVLKHQPEWSIHPGSSVSQPRAQIFAHATALRAE